MKFNAYDLICSGKDQYLPPSLFHAVARYELYGSHRYKFCFRYRDLNNSRVAPLDVVICIGDTELDMLAYDTIFFDAFPLTCIDNYSTSNSISTLYNYCGCEYNTCIVDIGIRVPMYGYLDYCFCDLSN